MFFDVAILSLYMYVYNPFCIEPVYIVFNVNNEICIKTPFVACFPHWTHTNQLIIVSTTSQKAHTINIRNYNVNQGCNCLMRSFIERAT